MITIPLSEALSRFLQAKEASGLSAKTIDWYGRMLREYVRWLEKSGIPEEQATVPDHIESFLHYHRSRGVSPYTVASYYRALRVFFLWLKRRRLLSFMESPMEAIDPPKVPQKKPRSVTFDDFQQLYRSIEGHTWTDQRDRAILLILFWSGLRAGELVNLCTANVNLEKQLLHVVAGKGDKDRLVPCTPELVQVLRLYLAARPAYDGPELFVANDGYGGVRGPLFQNSVGQMLERRCQAAGLPRVNPHAFRHGFATEMLNAGMELSAVSKAMGHASQEITAKVYARWRMDGIQREYSEARQRLQGPDAPPDLSSLEAIPVQPLSEKGAHLRKLWATLVAFAVAWRPALPIY